MPERRQPLRLLLLLPFAPRLDATHGGGQAMAQLLVPLSARHRLALLYFRADDEEHLDPLLQERCEVTVEIRRPVGWTSASARWRRRARLAKGLLRGRPIWASDWAVDEYGRRLGALAREWRPDLIQIEYQIMAQYLPSLAAWPAPRVLTVHEPGVSAARDLVRSRRGHARLLSVADLLAWRRFEASHLAEVQAVVTFTEGDRRVLLPIAGRTPIVRIPLGSTTPERPLDPLGHSPPILLFVGNYHHEPNVDAALRLCEAIFPAIRQRYPEAVLKVVGAHPPLHLRQAARDGVFITGAVPSVTPYLEEATLVVVPLRLGGGMRVKVLEALGAGKAIVASPLAAAGLDLVDGREIIMAETDQQYRDAIQSLIDNPARRVALARNARTWACTNLGWDGAIAAYEGLYARLLRRPQSEV